MTHILLGTYSVNQSQDEFLKTFSEFHVFEDDNGKQLTPSLREIKFWSISIPEKHRDQLLNRLYPFTRRMNISENESDFHGQSHLHGIDGTGFKIGIFRRMVTYILKLLNINYIDMNNYKTEHDTEFVKYLKSVHGKKWKQGLCMVMGELPDRRDDKGNEMI